MKEHRTLSVRKYILVYICKNVTFMKEKESCREELQLQFVIYSHCRSMNISFSVYKIIYRIETSDMSRVNIQDFNIKLLVSLSVICLLILVVSTAVIKKLVNSCLTFINLLVIVDCLISVAHIPIILQLYSHRKEWVEIQSPSFRGPVRGFSWICTIDTSYNYFFTSLNRAVPVAIAVYRYVHVFTHFVYVYVLTHVRMHAENSDSS